MSTEIRHVKQVKIDSLTRAVVLNVVWAASLDEMQTIMYMLIDMITRQHHEHARSIASKQVEMISLLGITLKSRYIINR